MEHTSSKGTALITGASSGIGMELARVFASKGHNLVLVARSADKLESLAAQFHSDYGTPVTVLTKDLFEARAPYELHDEVIARGLEIKYLVNDAGQGVYGEFKDTDLDAELRVVQLNINALIVLTKLFLKDMLARNEGRILQLASSVSTMPAPLQAVYAGTKAFVYNFSQSLIEEIADSKVTITTLRPGATETDFFNKAGAEDSKLVVKDQLGPADKVARDGYDALMAGSASIVSGWQNKVMDKLGHVTPEPLLAKAMHNMSEPADN